MKMSKKLLALLLSMILAFSCFALAASAADGGAGYEPIDEYTSRIQEIFQSIENLLQRIVTFFRNLFGIANDKAFYTVEVVSNENGTVSTVGSNPVLEDTSFICDIIPNEGYYVKTVLFGETDVTASLNGTRLVTPNLTANTTLTVVFEKIVYSVNVVISGLGTVTPSVSTSVLYGETASFTITPSTGQELVSVVFNGTDVTAEVVDGVYVTPAVLANGTLVVTFVDAIPENVIYVAPGGTGDGSSWLSPLGSIQAAISAANSATPVWVKGGTYSVSASITCVSGVNVYGGFAGTEERAGQRPKSDLDENGLIEPWEFTNATVITPAAANKIALVIPATVTADVIVDGFTFTNKDFSTGTVLVQVLGDTITRGGRGILRNCTITDSKNTGAGGSTYQSSGAVFLDGGTVDSCYFANNTTTGAKGGGSVFGYYSYSGKGAANTAYVTNSKFVSNTALYGAGIYFRGYNFSATNNIFVGNTSTGSSDSDGGAVFFVGGSATAVGNVDNNTFITNTADLTGGGLYMKNDATATRNLFLNNVQADTPQYSGSGAFTDNIATVADSLAAAGINGYYLVSPTSAYYNYGAVPVGTPA
ncbi:MAG: hypothetical protein LBS36_10325 [Oscillospiraceae bacterium]|jgi:hypothetical protein|nr:hypothetical protein [Oscillospiraceae bacterium]